MQTNMQSSYYSYHQSVSNHFTFIIQNFFLHLFSILNRTTMKTISIINSLLLIFAISSFSLAQSFTDNLTFKEFETWAKDQKIDGFTFHGVEKNSEEDLTDASRLMKASSGKKYTSNKKGSNKKSNNQNRNRKRY